MEMKTSDFDFDLPPEAIALRPAEPRDSAKLLYVGQELIDCQVKDLPKILKPGDLLVGNDTKVIPAQLTGYRGQAKIEVTLLKLRGNGYWQALVRPAKKLRISDRIEFAPEFHAVVRHKGEQGEIELDFEIPSTEFYEKLHIIGQIPLPPYIRKSRDPDRRDQTDYQTIYAREAGAIAAPTAGLHFTTELFDQLKQKGIDHAFLTLHVGAGTFLPVKSENLKDHLMHQETGYITEKTAAKINRTKKQGGRIIAIGTTVLRLLESAVDEEGQILPFNGATDIFLLPGHHFKSVDLLMTNFHLPRSTLFMLVCAFAGTSRMKQAYAYAISHDYRFYSYGDASLLELNK